ncbi:MAG: guanylate kinase [Chloroflexi bacterium]|nr:guanylate kinase [Chloroflexota bacterium]
MPAAPPLLAVISGPSGVGKDAIMSALLADGEFARPVTMTTRLPRPGEVDGVHYVFATREGFEAAVRSGELVEHAEVHGRLYGTPRAQLRDALASGRDVLLQVDVQGAIAIREAIAEARLLFIAPESLEQIEQRLQERDTDPAEIARRLDSARAELEQQDAFDAVIVNVEGALAGTVARVRDWIARERARPGRRAVEV